MGILDAEMSVFSEDEFTEYFVDGYLPICVGALIRKGVDRPWVPGNETTIT